VIWRRRGQRIRYVLSLFIRGNHCCDGACSVDDGWLTMAKQERLKALGEEVSDDEDEDEDEDDDEEDEDEEESEDEDDEEEEKEEEKKK
jgi:hypothetical protein